MLITVAGETIAEQAMRVLSDRTWVAIDAQSHEYDCSGLFFASMISAKDETVLLLHSIGFQQLEDVLASNFKKVRIGAVEVRNQSPRIVLCSSVTTHTAVDSLQVQTLIEAQLISQGSKS